MAAENGSSLLTKDQIVIEKYSHLQEKWISVSEAAREYKVLGRTIREWINLGYIEVDKTSYPMKLNQADVAYCAEIHHARSGISGVPLLDENGLAYQLKHPELSEYRQRKREEEQKVKAN